MSKFISFFMASQKLRIKAATAILRTDLWSQRVQRLLISYHQKLHSTALRKRMRVWVVEGAQYAIYKHTRQFTYRGWVSLNFQHLENNLRPLELSTEPSSDKTSTSIQRISHTRKCHPSAIFCPSINGKRRTGPNVTVTQYVAPCHATVYYFTLCKVQRLNKIKCKATCCCFLPFL